MSAKTVYKVNFGGWYQRTTLHLTEIYSFLAHGYSKLDLSKDKLLSYQNKLNLQNVTREVGYLEFVKAETKEGIVINYFEDGLYTLEYMTDDIENGKILLENYFNEKFNPAISYIFSLGAPTPKVLANIEVAHSAVVTFTSPNNQNFKLDKRKFGEIYSKLSLGGITVYKTPNYIFVATTAENENIVDDLADMQIFFREFKDQLEKYLNIHRIVWEEISQIKEKGFIKGSEIEEIRTRLDQYRKTINLIKSRINQMSVYIQTRASISKELKIDKYLTSLFQYKFEILIDTHAYISEIWQMTTDYILTAIDVVKDLENRTINQNLKTLQVITSIGVVAALIGYLTIENLPKVTLMGLVYLVSLIAIIFPINFLISFIYKNLKYRITFPERVTKI